MADGLLDGHFVGDECYKPFFNQEGETIKLLTRTKSTELILYSFIIHVFSLTSCCALHSTADTADMADL